MLVLTAMKVNVKKITENTLQLFHSKKYYIIFSSCAVPPAGGRMETKYAK